MTDTLFNADRVHRFISPHYDDTALSCGGLVAALTANGVRSVSEVVFGDEPDPAAPMTDFAAGMHADWGLTAEQVIASRRAEEAGAAAHLGFQRANLPFLDAIYRQDYYVSDALLFGTPSQHESALPSQIAQSLGLPAAASEDVRIYVPLAVGNHVDHQHAFLTGVALARAGWSVRFYEDLPYALMDGAFDRRMDDIRAEGITLEIGEVVDVAPWWDKKIDAIFAYPSQLETIFRHYVGVGTTRAEVSGVLRTYAETVGNGIPSERYWRLAGAAN